MQNDISITLTIYDNWQQTTNHKFFCRNLDGQTVEEQVAHAREVMNGVASELHYITHLGIDKGVVRVGGKKADEVLFPGKIPYEKTKWFRWGVNISFAPMYSYFWQKENKLASRIPVNEIDTGWELHKRPCHKKVSLRLPVHPSHKDEEPAHFLRYYGEKRKKRKLIGWIAVYDQKDRVFNQFIGRFFEGGHLCVGTDRYWGEALRPVDVKGVFWKAPKFGTAKMPRKSQIASQPTDGTDYVYLIRMGRTKMYKIGKTNDPQGRLASLQTASPYKLKLSHTFKADNASAAEETLHAKFHGVRLEGEWFKLTDAERDAILSVNEYKEQRFYINMESGNEGVSIDSLFAT